jgi:hypothetical protein
MLAIHAFMCVPFVHIVFNEISKKCLPYMDDISTNFPHNYKPIILIKNSNFPNTQFQELRESNIFYINSAGLCEQKIHFQVPTCTYQDVM